MGQFDYLVPGSTATAPKPVASTNQFASLIPKQTIPAGNDDTLSGIATNTVKGAATSIASPFVDAYNTFVNTPAPTRVAPTPQSYIDAFVSPNDSIGSNIMDSWSKVGNDFAKLTHNGAGTADTGLMQTGLDAVNAFFSPVTSVFNKAATVPGPIGDVANVVNKIFGSIGVVGADVAGAGAQHIPFVSQQTKDALEPVFKQLGALSTQIAAGKVGGDLYTKVADHTKTVLNTLAEDARLKELNKNMPTHVPVQSPEVGSRLPIDTTTTKVPVQDQTGVTQVPINTPATRHADYAASQGYEPYTSPDQLPTIQAGKTPSEILPTIQVGEKPSGTGSYKYVPIEDKATADALRNWINNENRLPDEVMKRFEAQKPGVDELNFNKDNTMTLYRDKTPKSGQIESYSIEQKKGQEPYTVNKDQIIANSASKAMADTFKRAYPGNDIQSVANKEMLAKYNKLEGEVFVRNTSQTLKPIKGTGDLKTRGLSQSLEASAIQKGLSSGFGELPEFKGADFGKIASDIRDHITTDPEGALKIAMGERAAPKGSIPEMYLNVLSKDALERGDVETIQKLATESKLLGGATTMGQRIAALGYKKDATDPVGLIRDVQQAREAALKAKGADVAKETARDTSTFKSATKATRTSSRESWTEFAQKLTCNL